MIIALIMPHFRTFSKKLSTKKQSAEADCFLSKFSRSGYFFHAAVISFENGFWHFGVVAEFHRVVGAASGSSNQLRRVADIGTTRSASMILTRDMPSPRSFISRMMPRLEFRSPTTSPINCSGVVTTTFMIGSRMAGLARSHGFLVAMNRRYGKLLPRSRLHGRSRHKRSPLTSTNG